MKVKQPHISSITSDSDFEKEEEWILTKHVVAHFPKIIEAIWKTVIISSTIRNLQ